MSFDWVYDDSLDKLGYFSLMPSLTEDGCINDSTRCKGGRQTGFLAGRGTELPILFTYYARSFICVFDEGRVFRVGLFCR
jgi:hypothetical protein